MGENLKEVYDIKKAKEAQIQYCVSKKLPHFAPIDGVCFRCHRNIYKKFERSDGNYTGITVEGAGSFLITGCPHCYRSFCD